MEEEETEMGSTYRGMWRERERGEDTDTDARGSENSSQFSWVFRHCIFFSVGVNGWVG